MQHHTPYQPKRRRLSAPLTHSGLALALALGLASCGGGTGDAATNGADSNMARSTGVQPSAAKSLTATARPTAAARSTATPSATPSAANGLQKAAALDAPTRLNLPKSAATASSNDGNVPSNTLDGNNSGTRWSARGDGQWIQYDLGAPKWVAYLDITWLRGDRRVQRFDVQISPDGRTWVTVLKDKKTSGSTAGFETFDFADTQGRYVRIVGHGNTQNNWNSILETEVYAAPRAPTPNPDPTPNPNPTTSWKPAVTDTWQWQLTGTLNTRYNATVYDIDLYDTPAATIASLKQQGRRVVCYFSAGSSENWRADFNQFNAADMGKPLDGWAGERWLDTRSTNVRNVMAARLDLARSKGCDGVEPDNVDGYTNSPGFPLSGATQIDYNRYLAAQAKARGLLIGLKNSTDLIDDLQPYFDFAVNEQCHQYNECGGYSAFTSRGKPVFNAEYKSSYVNDANARAQLCAASRAANIRTLVLPLSLDDKLRLSCD